MAAPSANPSAVVLEAEKPMSPPHWALLERELLRAQAAACQEFFDHYFDERGYLLCVPRWGGNDGPDDAAENFLNWTVLHALGADDNVLALYKRAWEGHLRQYTEAKTTEVPFARDGMYYKEFPVMFDWFHNGEGFSAFFLQGLSDPADRKLEQRMRRFAGFYMNEDSQAPNYDPEHKIIRSMFNGSRGPLLRKATGLDWAGDPIEVEGRFRAGHGEHNYEQFVAHFKDYNDVVGDNPLNLCTTTVALNAYALTGEAKYRDWLLEYTDAWVARTEQNGGMIPTNIGLDGKVGSAAGGRWYGGVYGWGFTVMVPQTGELAHRTYFHVRALWGFGNALMVTGDQRYVDTWRGVLNYINANAREIDGKLMWPNAYGDYFGTEDWYDWKPYPFHSGGEQIFYWSMKPEDRALSLENPWLDYLFGEAPNYPIEALQQDLDHLRRKVALMHADRSTPDTRLSDDMNHINPATTDALIRLMMGGLPTGRDGAPLHARLRYFDPVRRRAGMPEDVAALVEKLADEETVVVLVNTSPLATRTVIVQGGAYAEHQITSVRLYGQETAVNGSSFTVRLAPGCGARLTLKMKRYANQPTQTMPWI
ncbi:MAG: hypothetical protein KDE19_10385 [Caldilineaceae bacterium]|nr:hypothetical protein [Caldilineaceae bacterium]